MNDFLSADELALIASDHADLLASEEMSDITIHSRTPAGPVTIHPVYKIQSASGWNQVEIETRALQQIITKRNVEILRWGILGEGDAIFYLTPDQDLSGLDADAYIEAGSLKWKPVPKMNEAFYRFLVVRIGNQQFAQAIPCKLVDAS
jgi:hypothetical protein